MGTFLDFTRLYVYVHWMFFHFFFLVNEILAKSTILLNGGDIVHVRTFGQMKNLIILDIVTFFLFLHCPFFGIQFQMDRLFFLFYAVM